MLFLLFCCLLFRIIKMYYFKCFTVENCYELKIQICGISDFLCDANDILALLGSYAA